MLLAGKSQRTRLISAFLILLSPLAGALGALLTLSHDPNTKANIEIDRRAAINHAREYAASLGVDTTGWSDGHRIEVDNYRYFYYRLNPNEKTTALRRIAPELSINVLFAAPDGAEEVRIRLAPDGTPLGFTRKFRQNRDAQDQDLEPEAARTLADRYATPSAHLPPGAPAPTILGTPEMDEERDSGGVERTFSYRLDTAGLPAIEARREVHIAGEHVTRLSTTTKIEDDYADSRLLNRSLAVKIATGAYGLTLTLLFLYGLFRYFRLTQQKEAPHARTMVVCTLTGAAFILFAYQSEFYLFDIPFSAGVGYWIGIAFAGLSYLLMGFIFGIAYASGEGDVRETYPEKLTSLDALLRGRVFSRNVARAVLTGAVVGAWAMLGERLALLPFAARADAGQGLAEKTWQILGGTITPVVGLITPPFSGAWTATFGLLLPLAFLHRRRRLRSRKLFFLLLALLCMAANFNLFIDRPLHPVAAVLGVSVTTAALLAAFFLSDVLTAMAAAGVMAAATWVPYLVAQPASSLRRAGMMLLVAGLVLLLIETYFFFRGRLYAAADVRPLYARHLAERVQLQAEESAAREAQVRLMPNQLPIKAGVALAAVCHPAQIVGGDFYDIFPLEDERLGLFVAEGGGGGLGSALTIAFAKGFLMPRVGTSAAPAEVVCSLQSQLASLLDEGAELTILFAVIDPCERTLAYARTGDYPRVHVARDGDGTPGAASVEAEREWSVGQNGAGDCKIREATLRLGEKDTALFFTDGIGKTLMIERTPPADFVRRIAGRRTHRRGGQKQEASLQRELEKAIAVQARRARRINLNDDLTAIIVRFDSGNSG